MKEHKYVVSSESNLQYFLDKYAKLGWELVAVTQGYHFHLFFAREMPSAADDRRDQAASHRDDGEATSASARR